MKKIIALLLCIFFNTFSQASTVNLYSNDPTAAATNLYLLQAAIALAPHGDTLQIACGFYYINPGISITSSTKNLTLRGCSNGNAYESVVTSNTTYSGGTVLYFASSGSIGFDLTSLSGAGNYTRISNLVISGGGSVDACIKISGAVLIDHVNIQDCRNKGVWLYELINGTTIDYVSVNNNVAGEGYGLYVGTGYTTLNDNTKFRISNSSFRQNKVGVHIGQANGYSFNDTTIESNSQNGLELDRVHTTSGHDRNTNGRFVNVWLENNGTASNSYANLVSNASAPSYDDIDTPSYITFENGTFVSYGSHNNIVLNSGQHFDFRNSSIQSADPTVDGPSKSPFIAGAYSSYVSFYNVQGNYIVTDNGLHNSLTSNYYQSGSFTWTLDGCAAPITGIGYYTVFGNMVTVDLPNLICMSGSQTKTLTGLPQILWANHAVNATSFMQDNGGAYQLGWIQNSAGVITFMKDGSGNLWTPYGQFVARAFSMNYILR
jgi:hypothetical protein